MAMKHFVLALALSSCGSCAFCGTAMASEQVYHPVSPSFGGNSLNGTYILQQAQAQGLGAKSGQQSPDLSGLTNALGNLGTGSGSAIVISPNNTPSPP
jgi:curli production assembly/transport component CsgF